MEQRVIEDLVEAVAEAEGVEPTDLDYSLQEYIPLDAVTQLAAHENASWTLMFELPGHTVTVTSDGTILVNEDKEEVRA